MAELMGNMRRSVMCGEVTENDIGKELTAAGFCDRIRDKGPLVFIDLRDRTGILQLTFDDSTERAVFEKAKSCKNEYVVIAKGILKKRESINPDLKTGMCELFVTEFKILATAQTPPFHVNGDGKVGDETALTYRYLDLRRERLQRNIIKRHEIARVTREYFYENGFLEIETPMLMRSTPEGARDYLVPSRVHQGSFYALPQSPQIYKQLLMISGFDRYIQLARCFRDEDLRADRQPEFTQIDLEMSFVDTDDIMKMAEGYIKRLFKEIENTDITLPIERMTYAYAMENYGSDKPDLRFDMKLTDLSAIVENCGFSVFSSAVENGGSVRAIVAKGGASTLSRKELDKLTEQAKGIGAKGLAYIRFTEESKSCSFAKFISEETLAAIEDALSLEKGDVALIVADKNSVVLPVLGQLRLTVAKKLDIIKDEYRFVWITEFPFFEYDEDLGDWVAMHHPFTMPMDECLQYLDSDKGKVKAKAYDLVLNGVELSSGSMRITDYELQEKMFRSLGLTNEEIEAKFGFLVQAYHYGAPPHGGLGIGLDRLSMILCGEDSLREVVAFPKVQNASELMSGAPSAVDEQQLKELHINTD